MSVLPIVLTTGVRENVWCEQGAYSGTLASPFLVFMDMDESFVFGGCSVYRLEGITGLCVGLLVNGLTRCLYYFFDLLATYSGSSINSVVL